MLKKQLKRLGAVALCAALLLVPLVAAALPASASSVVLLEDTVLELEPYFPVSTFSLLPDNELDLSPSATSAAYTCTLKLSIESSDALVGQPVYVALDGITYQCSVVEYSEGIYYFGDYKFQNGNGLPFYVFFSDPYPAYATAYFTRDFSGSVFSVSAEAPEDGSILFLGDLFTVGNSLLQLVADICAAIVADPLLLMTTGVLFLGAVVGILGRLLSKS